MLLNADPDNPAPFASYLDLDIFDNSEYDSRTPNEWLELGLEGEVRKPVPGKALLPAKNPIYSTCMHHTKSSIISCAIKGVVCYCIFSSFQSMPEIQS